MQSISPSGEFGEEIESSRNKIIFDELERQAIWTFNIFVFAAATNVLAITVTAGLWMAAKTPEANYAGLGSGGCLPIVWMTGRKARESRDKLLMEAKELCNK
ncbi:MAG: hypothetical protein PUP91_06945 [Rhizonema sp. PD37]|nr:hypothetical protein [Rhizonema sp. PD37]